MNSDTKILYEYIPCFLKNYIRINVNLEIYLSKTELSIFDGIN